MTSDERNFRRWLSQQRQVSDYVGLALELLLVTSLHCLRVVTYEAQLLEALREGTCLQDGGQGEWDAAEGCLRAVGELRPQHAARWLAACTPVVPSYITPVLATDQILPLNILHPTC